MEKRKKETITLKGNGYFDLGDHLALTGDLPGEKFRADWQGKEMYSSNSS